MMKRGGGQDTSQPGTNVSVLAVGVSHLTMALDLKISPPKLMELALHKKTHSDRQKKRRKMQNYVRQAQLLNWKLNYCVKHCGVSTIAIVLSINKGTIIVMKYFRWEAIPCQNWISMQNISKEKVFTSCQRQKPTFLLIPANIFALK